MEILAAVLFLCGSMAQAYDNDLAFVAGYITMFVGLDLFCYHSYATSKHFEIKKRIVMIISILVSIIYASSIISIYMESDTYSNAFAIIGMCTFVCLLIRTAVLSYKTGECYNVRGTYLAFKKPKNFQGYAHALIKKYGSVSLVVNSKEFLFKDGELIERSHVKTDKITYQKIDNVPLYEARKLLGTRWKWYRNCFSVLEGIAYRAKQRRNCKTSPSKRGFRGRSE